jgi:hypothetical protein
MFRRFVAAAFAAALMSTGLVLVAGSAHADTCPTTSPKYPSDTCGISTSTNSGVPGSDVTVAGDGFSKNCGVVVRFDSTQVGTATSNSAGHFSTTVTVPSNASAGTHSITASDQCSSFVLATQFTVNAVSGSGGLPFTGAVFWPLLFGGSGLVVVGFLLVVAGRHRRQGVTPAI